MAGVPVVTRRVAAGLSFYGAIDDQDWLRGDHLGRRRSEGHRGRRGRRVQGNPTARERLRALEREAGRAEGAARVARTRLPGALERQPQVSATGRRGQHRHPRHPREVRSRRAMRSFSLVLLRTLIGWHFAYEGYYKLVLPGWSRGGGLIAPFSAEGYL